MMFMDSEDGCKKRKCDWTRSSDPGQQNKIGVNGQKFKQTNSAGVGIDELHLEFPLPPEWEQCLDLQSGEIYYYNTTTQMKTWQDPRERARVNPSYFIDHLQCLSAAPVNNQSMRLDLELNLPSPFKNSKENDQRISSKSSASSRWSSNLLIDGNSSEMVAVACMKCHMLVMVCKASPSCPNCKYLHPIHHKLTAQKTDIMPIRETLSLLDYANHGQPASK